MTEVKVKVFGPDPPCSRCQAAKKAAEKAAEKLRQQNGVIITVEKANIISREAIQKYGILLSPAIAINDVVKVIGRVPSEEEIEKLLKEELSRIEKTNE
jgi:glutaredoxin